MLVHRCSAHQRLPVLKTHCIPLEHRGRTVQILVRVISIEERVQETLLFGLPSFKLKLRTRLRSLPSAPFNARCYGIGRVCHGSPLHCWIIQALTVWPFCLVARQFGCHRAVTKFIHVLPGGLAVHCLARRTAVACPIRKATALPLDVMRSVRLVLGKAACHSSEILRCFAKRMPGDQDIGPSLLLFLLSARCPICSNQLQWFDGSSPSRRSDP